MVLSTMDQSSDLLNSLSEFARSPTRDVPPDLEVYLANLSRSGVTNASWQLVKPLIRVKLESSIDSFLTDPTSASIDEYYPRPNMETFQLSAYRHSALSALDQFTNAPFTIQRLCELILSPGKHYRRIDKYLRGLLKCLTVVSCVDSTGQKIVFDQDEEEDMIVSNSADSDSSAIGVMPTGTSAACASAAAAASTGSADSADEDLEGSGSGSGSEASVPEPVRAAPTAAAAAAAPVPAELDDEDGDEEEYEEEEEEIETDASSSVSKQAAAVVAEVSAIESNVAASNSEPVASDASNSDVEISDAPVAEAAAATTDSTSDSTAGTVSTEDVVVEVAAPPVESEGVAETETATSEPESASD